MRLQIFLNGSQLSFDVSLIIENGTTRVPLRAIFEPLGASVQWDGATQTIIAVKTGTTIKLTLGHATALKNGAQLSWDGNTQVITITSSPISSPAGSPPPFVSANQIQVHFIDQYQFKVITC